MAETEPPGTPGSVPTPVAPRPGFRPWILPAFAAALIIAFGAWQLRSLGARAADFARPKTTVTHDMVVERVRDVAKLVTSETTVRDVVVYEQTRLGSTKKSLVVVTGKLLAGFNLELPGTNVQVNDTERTITITLPPPQLLAVEIVSMRTYDERAGLWNPFSAEDRDAIYRTVRQQLWRAGQETGAATRAGTSASRLLEAMFAAEGYRTRVVVPMPAPVIIRE